MMVEPGYLPWLFCFQLKPRKESKAKTTEHTEGSQTECGGKGAAVRTRLAAGLFQYWMLDVQWSAGACSGSVWMSGRSPRVWASVDGAPVG